MDILRLITAGNVDDGKSTLIGKLLHDTDNIKTDLIQSVSNNPSSTINLAHITDGLREERARGITVDVAYQYFTTKNRKYILTDAPGHFMYTKNLVTGASCVDMMIILIDAEHGITLQTKKHSLVASFLNIKKIVVTINKMDLVGYNQQIFENIKNEYLNTISSLQIKDIDFIPISALYGDNLFITGEKMNWYKGETLMQLFENYQYSFYKGEEVRFSVQYVVQHEGRNGYLGNLLYGNLNSGDTIVIHPGNRLSVIDSIVDGKNSISSAEAGQQICLFLKDENEIQRGAVFTSPANTIKNSHSFEVTICWIDANSDLKFGKEYYLRIHAAETICTIKSIVSKIDAADFEKANASDLVSENEFAIVIIETKVEIAFDQFLAYPSAGRGIIIDPLTNYTSGAFVVN